MAPGYGHSNGGVNIANYRLVSEKRAQADMGYRTPFDWAQETLNQVTLGQAENKMSTTLRNSSNLVQAAAAEQVVTDITSVELALRAKLRHTEQLKNALQSTVMDVMSEVQQCALLKGSLEQRLRRVGEKIDLNESRLQVRSNRPHREKTMDDVEGVLLQQQGLMSSFDDRVKRAIGHIEKEMQQLDHVRQKLEADLKDKIDAIDVDSKVLAVQPDGSAGEAASLRRKGQYTLKTPNSWVSSTEDNIKNARRWLADSVRLRKAIRYAVEGARAAEHETSRNLNNQMMNKIGQTRGLRKDLQLQLAKVREEQSRAESQRSSLVHALESKRGPLAQAKERLAARKARPDRELVQDDVEAALSKEVAHLNAITSQLAQKMNAVDKTISALDLSAMTLEDNIRDKDTTLAMDERMAFLDGRINLTAPPPSSVGSFSGGSHISEIRESTMKRINELENELQSARMERETLESNIQHLKATLSPKGPLSPSRHMF